jgi:Holliday junction resolvase
MLLGLTLKKLGFKVPYCQLAGRPDIVAMKGSKGYRMEVKAPTEFEVTIGNKDLEGVIDASGHQPVIAVLSYPEVKTKWIMVNALHLHAGKFNKISLEEHSIRSLEKEINSVFGNVLERYYDDATKGCRSLKRVFNRV